MTLPFLVEVFAKCPTYNWRLQELCTQRKGQRVVLGTDVKIYLIYGRVGIIYVNLLLANSPVSNSWWCCKRNILLLLFNSE